MPLWCLSSLMLNSHWGPCFLNSLNALHWSVWTPICCHLNYLHPTLPSGQCTNCHPRTKLAINHANLGEPIESNLLAPSHYQCPHHSPNVAIRTFCHKLSGLTFIISPCWSRAREPEPRPRHRSVASQSFECNALQ